MTESSCLTLRCSFLLVFICQALVPTLPSLIGMILYSVFVKDD